MQKGFVSLLYMPCIVYPVRTYACITLRHYYYYYFFFGHTKKEKTAQAIGQVSLGFILTLFFVSAVYLNKLISLSH